jgi:hypothetical protein
MNLEELEAEVTRLEDIHEIENLERMYGYYFDTRRMKEIVDLFSEETESVEIESHGQFLGKEGVRKMYLVGAGGEGQGRPGEPAAARPRPSGGGTVIIQIGGVITLAPDGKKKGKGEMAYMAGRDLSLRGCAGPILAARLLRE